MTTIFLPALILAIGCILVICAMVAIDETYHKCKGMTLKDLFTGRFFEEYFHNLGDILFSKCSFFILVCFTGIFMAYAFDASKSIEEEKKGECTCKCKRCQEIDAIFKKLFAINTNYMWRCSETNMNEKDIFPYRAFGQPAIIEASTNTSMETFDNEL